jgi:hypothetical protein
VIFFFGEWSNRISLSLRTYGIALSDGMVRTPNLEKGSYLHGNARRNAVKTSVFADFPHSLGLSFKYFATIEVT